MIQDNTKDLISDISTSIDSIRQVHKTNVENQTDVKEQTEFLLEKLARIDVALEEIKDDQKKIIQLLTRSSSPSNATSPCRMIEMVVETAVSSYPDRGLLSLPITTVEGVMDLDEKCLNIDFAQEFAKVAAQYCPDSQGTRTGSKGPYVNKAITGLAQLFDDSVLIKFNWDGAKGRLAFCHLTKLNNVLFGAWKSSKMPTYNDYTSSVRHQLMAAKARRNQRVKRVRDNMIKDATTTHTINYND